MSDASAPHIYAIALGSNRQHGRYGAPERVIDAALDALGDGDVDVLTDSGVIESDAIGPSLRRYANATALIETAHSPPALLALLKSIECDFGRRRGQRWGARVIDIDIILWSGGSWSMPTLSIPHPHWRSRRFVTDPLARIAPDWRDPLTGLTVRHLAHRLRKPQPVDPAPRTA